MVLRSLVQERHLWCAHWAHEMHALTPASPQPTFCPAQAAFGPFYRIEQLIISSQSSDGDGDPILTDANVKLLFDIQAEVDALRAPAAVRLLQGMDLSCCAKAGDHMLTLPCALVCLVLSSFC